MSHDNSVPAYNQISDNDLISLSKNGDEDAFSCLILRHRDMVRKISCSYFSVALTPDDWYQEGMIGLLYAVQSYRESESSASFPTFASVIIKNRLNTVWRSINSMKNLPLNNYLLYDDIIIPAVSSIEDDYIENERYVLFAKSISENLSKTERKVFSCYIAGFSYKETADKLRISEKSVDNALYRIKSKLRKVLQDQNNFV